MHIGPEHSLKFGGRSRAADFAWLNLGARLALGTMVKRRWLKPRSGSSEADETSGGVPVLTRRRWLQGSDGSDSESDGLRTYRGSARSRATSSRTRSARVWECPDSGSSEAAETVGGSGSVLRSGACGTGVVDLCSGALAAVHSRGEREGRLSEYETNGMDLKRLRTVMASPCGSRG